MSEEIMNDDNQQQEVQEQEVKTYTQQEVEALLNKEVGGLKNKVHELLSEKKAAVAKAEEEAVKQRGDIEELKAFYEQRDKERAQEHQQWKQEIAQAQSDKAKHNIINSMVGDFVDGEAAAFMLKSMIDVQGDNEVYRDFSGNVVADNAADFKKWVQTNPHMSHFLRGTQATGGGANGNTKGARGVDNNTMPRADFEAMTPGERMDFIKKGGTLV